MINLKRTFKNAGWLALDRGYRLLLAFFTGVLLARYLGPESYGDMGYCISIVGLLSGLVALGLDRLVVRDLIQEPGSEPQILGNLLFLKGGMSLIVTMIVCAYVVITGYGELLPVALLFSLASVAQLMEILDLRFQAHHEFGKIVPVRLLAVTISAALKLWLMHQGFGLFAFALLTACESLFISIGALWVYKIHLRAWPILKTDWPRLGRTLKEGWPLVASINLDTVSQRLSTVMLGLLLLRSQFGEYVLAMRMLDIPLTLVYLVSTIFLPDLTKAWMEDRGRYWSLLQKGTRWWTMGSIVFVASACLLAYPVFPLLLGERYPNLPLIFILSAFSIAFQANGIFRAAHLTILGKQKALLFINISTLAVSLPCFWLLSSRYGVLGAAVSVSLGNLFGYVLLSWAHPDSRPFFWIQLKALVPVSQGSKTNP